MAWKGGRREVYGGGLTSGMDEKLNKKLIAAVAAAAGVILGAWEAGAMEGQGGQQKEEEEEGGRKVQACLHGHPGV